MKNNVLLLSLASLNIHAMHLEMVKAQTDLALGSLTPLQKAAIMDDVDEVNRILNPKENNNNNVGESSSPSSQNRLSRLRDSVARAILPRGATQGTQSDIGEQWTRISDLCDQILSPCMVHGSKDDTLLHHVAGGLAFRILKKRSTVAISDPLDTRAWEENGYYFPCNKAKILGLLLKFPNQHVIADALNRKGDDGFTPMHLAVIAALVCTKNGYNVIPEVHKSALETLATYSSYSKPTRSQMPTALALSKPETFETFFADKIYPLRIMHALRTNPNLNVVPPEYTDYAVDASTQQAMVEYIRKLSREAMREYISCDGPIIKGYTYEERAYILANQITREDPRFEETETIWKRYGTSARETLWQRLMLQDVMKKQDCKHLKLTPAPVYCVDDMYRPSDPRWVSSDDEITLPIWLSYVLLHEDKKHDPNIPITAEQAKELCAFYKRAAGNPELDVRVTNEGIFIVSNGYTRCQNRVNIMQALLLSPDFTYAPDAKPIIEKEIDELKKVIYDSMREYILSKPYHIVLKPFDINYVPVIGLRDIEVERISIEVKKQNDPKEPDTFLISDIKWDRLFKTAQEKEAFFEQVNAAGNAKILQ